MNKTPLVSVKMLAYNQEKYIGQAIESVISQKTNFPFELIIGEDCSTDRTREIVLDYKRKNPDIIRIITSKKNVGMRKNGKRIREACLGKYQASCEGDDYWCDPKKLQRQVEIMEANPNISLCFHAVDLEGDMRYIRNNQWQFPNRDKIFSLRDLLRHDNLRIVKPVSQMIRSDLVSELPNWYFESPVGDIPMILFSAYKGDTYYINQVMAVYQLYAENSWNLRFRENLVFRINHFNGKAKMWTSFDQYTKYEYHDLINRMINKEFSILLFDKDLSGNDLEKLCKDHYKELSGALKAFIYLIQKMSLKAFFINAIRFLRTIKRKLIPGR